MCKRHLFTSLLPSLFLLTSSLMLAACGDDGAAPTDGGAAVDGSTPVDAGSPMDAGPPDGAEFVKSEKPRVTEPGASPASLESLAEGNRRFAFELYGELRGEEGNLFLSPYSISVALAMTYAGAEGRTERQMAEALHFDLDEADLHPAFNAVDLALDTRGERASGSDGGPFRLNVVNATWGQTGYSFEDAYMDVLAESYGAGMYQLDFVADPEEARTVINDWVELQTEDRILDLIPPGAINALTRLVLTNAIYFNAAWATPFEEDDTTDSSFRLLGGDTVTVPMMHQVAGHPYAEGDGWQAVQVGYEAHELGMLILLPAEGRFAEVEAALDAAMLTRILDGLSGYRVTLSVPRFSFESSFGLNDPLIALGMTDAFAPSAADFSGIDGTRELFIQAVLHKAFVAVNEAGTEAAAATAVIVGTTSVPPSATVTLDRPFLFMILDRPTGQVLFLGRVLDPRAT